MNYVYLCALLSAVFAGAVPILAKVGIKGIDSNLATTVRVLMLVPILCVLIAFQGTAGKIFKFTPTNWLFLLLSAVATGLSWLFYFYALSKRDATWVAPIDKSSLAFTLILGVFVLGEKMTWQNVLASMLVLAALGVTLIPSKARPLPTSAPTAFVEPTAKP